MDRWAVDNISAEKIILCALLNKIISWMDSGSLALSLVVYVCVLTFTIVLKRTFDEQFLRCQRKVSDAFSMISKKQSCQTQIEFIILRFKGFNFNSFTNFHAMMSNRFWASAIFMAAMQSQNRTILDCAKRISMQNIWNRFEYTSYV